MHNRRFPPLLGFGVFALVNLRRFYRPILLEAADRIGADDALTKVEALMNWRAFGPILQRGLKRSGAGPQAMIRWYCSNAF